MKYKQQHYKKYNKYKKYKKYKHRNINYRNINYCVVVPTGVVSKRSLLQRCSQIQKIFV